MNYLKQKVSILLLMIPLSISPLVSQNIVLNSDFESGTAPDNISQMNRCNDWSTLQMGTADYYGNGEFEGMFAVPTDISCFSSTGGPMQAKSGKRFVGFGSCEGIYTKLTSTLSLCSTFKISFWFSPRCYGQNQEINAYLLEESIDNISFDRCFNPDGTIDAYKFSPMINSEIDIAGNVIHKPGEWYFYESDLITVTDVGVNLSGLFIKGKETPTGGGDFGSTDYVYIDDVQINKIDICNNKCVTKSRLSVTDSDGVDYYTDGQIGFTAVVVPNENPFFNLRINYGVEYEFWVWDRNGGLVHKDIRSICSDWFIPCWNGHEDGHTTLTLPTSFGASVSLYTFDLIVRGCGEDNEIIITGNIAIDYVNFNIGDPVEDSCEGEDFQNPTPSGPSVYCCPQEEEIIDYALSTSGLSFVQADESVILNGVVVFNNTTFDDRVVVQAGEFIKINNSRTARGFGHSIAIFKIADCIFDKSGKAKKRDDLISLAPKSNFIAPKEHESQEDILIYPNPCTGIVNIESNQLIKNIVFYNTNGEKLNDISYNLTLIGNKGSSLQVDFAEKSVGVYIATIYTDTEIISKKINIIR